MGAVMSASETGATVVCTWTINWGRNGSSGSPQVSVTWTRVPQPRRFSLFARLRFGIIGRADHALSVFFARACSPFGFPSRHLVILLPDLAQDLYTVQGFSLLWRIGAFQGCQHMKPIGSNLAGQGGALTLAFRQTVVLHPMAIALKPIGADLFAQPVGGETSQIVQGRPQRLSDTFQIGKRAHPRQHMSGVGPLLAPFFEPATLFANLDEPLE